MWGETKEKDKPLGPPRDMKPNMWSNARFSILHPPPPRQFQPFLQVHPKYGAVPGVASPTRENKRERENGRAGGFLVAGRQIHDHRATPNTPHTHRSPPAHRVVLRVAMRTKSRHTKGEIGGTGEWSAHMRTTTVSILSARPAAAAAATIAAVNPSFIVA